MPTTMPASTKTTMAACVQIQNGDMQPKIRGSGCARIAPGWSPQRLIQPPAC
jgi:hypothetical protein